MDIEIDGAVGRMEFALYDTIVPTTVANFESLCKNQCKNQNQESKLTSKTKGYTKNNAKFFRVVDGFVAQCGMMPLSGNFANISERGKFRHLFLMLKII